MKRLRMATAGESHGAGITCLLEGLPAGLRISAEQISAELARRQQGYGRGGRMQIEQDRAELLAGVRGGRTLGTPVVCFVPNRDYDNWQGIMGPETTSAGERSRAFSIPRPGHGDLAGALKYRFRDLRNVLERTSARETAGRVAAGAICKGLLAEVGVGVGSMITRIGQASWSGEVSKENLASADASSVRCPDAKATLAMEKVIDEAAVQGDSVGGQFIVVAFGVPCGLGSYAQWDERLDGALAGALMSIQAIKAVEIGAGVAFGALPGSHAHDEIVLKGGADGFVFDRGLNNAGGLEAGITNGAPVVLRCTMKPIPTLRKPLASVDLCTGEPAEAHSERSDVCAVPAAAVVAEAMVALVLADAVLVKFGGDTVKDVQEHVSSYTAELRKLEWLGDEQDR